MSNTKINSEQIAIVCQCDVNKQYLREVEYLFQSISCFGGNLAKAQKFLLFRGKLDKSLNERFEKIGIITRKIEEIDSRDVFANKIRNLEITDNNSIEKIISLDVDTLVVKDFSSYLKKEFIYAKPADMSPLSIDDWKYLFDFFNLDFPKERYKTHFDFRDTIPYFNTGVLIIPKKYALLLRNSWEYYVKCLLDSYQLLPENIKKYSHFNNQFAFSLALVKTKIPFKNLPLEMNFPTHHTIHSNFKPETIEPYLIHHHHRYAQSGKLLPTKYKKINNIIDQMNKIILSKIEQK